MNTRHDRRVNQLLETLLDLDEESREKRLKALFHQEPEVHEDVLELLKIQGDTNGLLQDPVLSSMDRIGAQLGPYQLEKELGSGGMGSVFLARRTDDFESIVAIKLIRQGYEDGVMRAKFERERQILAHLQHPNIARLLDGGTSENGLPFLVMEHIHGEDIISYSNHHRLDLAQRLGLFEKICEAVQYAHANLVIHRDLKPHNILVDSYGEPKLLDFGIAGLLSETSEDTTLQTNTPAMSPQYASPEQYQGKPLTTSTDIYSLGVLLYELLVDESPYGRSLTNSEMPTRIIEGSIIGLGNCWAGFNQQRKKQIAYHRNTGERALNQQFKSDLNYIASKILEKDPKNRYSSVGDLKNDLVRFQKDLPLEAAPKDHAYIFKKFMRRNRVALSMAFFTVFMLAIAPIGYGVAKAREQKQTAYERDSAEQVIAFMNEMFRASDPFLWGTDYSQNPRVEDILKVAAKKLETDLTGQPRLRARLLDNIGDIYFKLGLFKDAAPLWRMALNERRKMPENKGELSRSLLHMGLLMSRLGKYEESDRYLTESLTLCRAVHGSHGREFADIQANRADLFQVKGEYPQSEALYREAIEIYKALVDEDPITYSKAINSLGILLDQQGRYKEANDLHMQSLEIQEKYLGEKHPDIGVSLINLATSIQRQGRVDEAIEYLHRARSILKESLKDDHAMYATATHNLASIFLDRGKVEESIKLFEEALEIRRQAFGENHPRVASVLGNLGKAHQMNKNMEKAEACFEKALAISLETLGERHRTTANQYASLGAFYRSDGRLDKARENLEIALHIRTEIFQENHSRVGIDHNNLAAVLNDLGRADEAEYHYRKAVEICRSSLGPKHQIVGILHKNLLNALSKRGLYDEVCAAIPEVWNILKEKGLTVANDHMADAVLIKVDCLIRGGALDEAIRELDKMTGNESLPEGYLEKTAARRRSIQDELKPK